MLKETGRDWPWISRIMALTSFLSLIDCGPSKYALWRQLSSSYGSVAIVRILRLIFCERGAPSEILTDNEPTFKTKEIRSFLDSWGVQIRFRAAYYPEGNGIVERKHRTLRVAFFIFLLRFLFL